MGPYGAHIGPPYCSWPWPPAVAPLAKARPSIVNTSNNHICQRNLLALSNIKTPFRRKNRYTCLAAPKDALNDFVWEHCCSFRTKTIKSFVILYDNNFQSFAIALKNEGI